MWNRHRKKLRKLEQIRLLSLTEKQKYRLDNQKKLITQSVDPSDYVFQQMKITESIYLFLLREARNRKVNKNEL
ncbi:YaaL family protein [bacterium LRH843]|nr:YaaL family protein [bacterium LRH843]